MSRERVRPTREQTRQRLFTAAAGVFTDVGVGAATVEQVATAAGLTRGAFYSNFSSMEELAAAMLEDHLAQSWVHNRSLAGQHPDPADLVRALRDDTARADDPLHVNPLLQVELMLFVARNTELRVAAGEHIRAMRRLVGEIATSALHARGADPPLGPTQLGTILVALEDGLRLHQLIDPDATPADAFFDALDALVLLAAPPNRPRRPAERRGSPSAPTQNRSSESLGSVEPGADHGVAGQVSSRWTRAGAKAGRQTERYSAPAGVE
jgi:AcrR family transcriptional regulator